MTASAAARAMITRKRGAGHMPSAHPAGGDPMLLGIAPQTGNAIVVQGAQPARRSKDQPTRR